MTVREGAEQVILTVELYGLARMAAGERRVRIAGAPDATVREAIAALAEACPRLVGRIISEDLSQFLAGYVFNHNARTFLDVLDARLAAEPGDVLILMSAMAGG